ncbi:MAG: hypothetical protein VST70_00200 [Nitrospirota bacterium]|nr:hypothetical protein [Nitrospirota bacterium]
MIEIHERVLVASDLECTRGNSGLAVVHACKSPCHQRVVGYSGNLQKTHPNYLVLEQGYDLFLNIIDPSTPLFMPQLFTSFLSFATKHWEEGTRLLIHCNQGESRAPSLALLFLAKSLSAINNSSYLAARKEFEPLYPQYKPGKGIEAYFSNNWKILGDI